jgi:hydroxymethylbilane synthase
MTTLRAGTRGSDLALWQTRWVADRLRVAHPSLVLEEVIIKTHGDLATEQKFDADWPVGGFVGAIEQALSANTIDYAVHSYKDLQTAVTPGLIIAAIPAREIVHDVLVTRESVDLDRLPEGFRLGTSSPRRAAQFKRLGVRQIVPLRGNVPTRIAKIERENLDGVILAAAGLKRLGIEPPHRTDLPTDRFVPAPAQGALAIQTREGDEAAEVVAVLDDATTRRCVTAERGFLRTINAGCHVPVAALARVEGDAVTLHAQLFSEDGVHLAEGVERGDRPEEVGDELARRLLRELDEKSASAS